MRARLKRSVMTIAALLASSATLAQSGTPTPASDPLLDGFRNPPDSARPRTWWHWLNGNITEDGIVKDLTWMKRVGLGGVQTFDASLMTPQIVDKRLAYMTPEWRHAFQLAARTADTLGLEFAIAGSPGWSETGGPWVPPADGMKKLVWSETDLVGGRRVTTKLAPPPSVSGPFQALPFEDPLAAFEGKSGRQPPQFYADVAVLAYPIVELAAGARATATPTINGAPAPAGDIALVHGKPGAPALLTLDYAAPVTIRSAALFVRGALPPFGDAEFLPVLEAQTAAGWQRVASVPLGTVPTTVSFAPVTARSFRFVFAPNTAPPTVGLGAPAPGVVMDGVFPGQGAAPPPIRVGHVALSAAARVDRFEAKAGFATVGDYYALSTAVPDEAGFDPKQVIDLTGKMRPDGTLDWTPPAGRWRVLRLGSSLLGTTNHPATPEATGLEVDKYDASAVSRYVDTYLGNYRAAVGPDLIGKAGVRALVTDSFEAGDANWTPRLAEQFKRLRGYDLTPWLPALTGTVVGSRAQSDAFLYDYRRTLADLMASEHYGTVARVAHANGLKVYGEALENGRPALGNDIALRAHADVPMAAMWTFPSETQPRPTLIGDVRGAASVAHLYGQNLVAAESFTSAFAPWAFAPADLKHVADFEFVNGINRPVIHTSVHQPTDDKLPGLSLAIFGQYFNRHDSWAELARPWIDYLARTSFMLQQGSNVADVAYFFGEEAPLTQLYAQAPLADVPVTHGYDFVDADALIGQLSVADGELVARSGARYRVLYLGGTSRRMTLPVLKRIAALVEAGATVIGDAPVGSPSLPDDRGTYESIVRRLWGPTLVTRVGQGRVVAGRDIEAALRQIALAPDFSFAKPKPDSDVPFLHRQLADGDAYFVVNRHARREAIEAHFRVTGRVPELWHADTGQSTPVSYRIEQGQTIIPLDLAAEDAVFVVFRTPSRRPSAALPTPPRAIVRTIEGPWSVAFQPGRGAPASIALATLAPLETQRDPALRYFSGIASYTTSVTVSGTAARHQTLDLGRVGDIAEVRVNGRLVGTAWHAPYQVDVGAALKPGKNRIEIRVANTWVNRLVGDAQPGAAKHSWTAMPTYRADAPLRPSGLIGPVTLTSEP